MTEEKEWSGEGWELRDDEGSAHPVTVGHLKEWLAGIPDHAWVVLSRDAEGNGYKPLFSVSKHMVDLIDPTSTRGIFDVELREEDDDTSESDQAVVLWPWD